MTGSNFGGRDLNVSRPSAARIYDYLLGGDHHFAVDRRFAAGLVQKCPSIGDVVLHNRAFLRRAAAFCARQGVRRYLDIGAGIPTVGNTHQIVQKIIPDAHVVYVDNDRTAVNQSADLLDREGVTTAAAIEGDLRDPTTILDHPQTRRLIDLTEPEPVAVLLVAVLHFLSDADRPYEIVASIRDRLPSGSYLVAAIGSGVEAAPEVRAQHNSLNYDDTDNPGTSRSRAEFAAFFDGFQLVDPGVAYAAEWRPEHPVDPDDPARPCVFAAVGQKP